MKTFVSISRLGIAGLPALVLCGMGAKAFVVTANPQANISVAAPANIIAESKPGNSALSLNIETASGTGTSQTVSMGLIGQQVVTTVGGTLVASTGLPVIVPVRTPIRP